MYDINSDNGISNIGKKVRKRWNTTQTYNTKV